MRTLEIVDRKCEMLNAGLAGAKEVVNRALGVKRLQQQNGRVPLGGAIKGPAGVQTGIALHRLRAELSVIGANEPQCLHAPCGAEQISDRYADVIEFHPETPRE